MSQGKAAFSGGCPMRQAHIKNKIYAGPYQWCPYAPVSNTTRSRIGIAISTHNRAGVISKALEYYLRHLLAGALVFVVDDGYSHQQQYPTA